MRRVIGISSPKVAKPLTHFQKNLFHSMAAIIVAHNSFSTGVLPMCNAFCKEVKERNRNRRAPDASRTAHPGFIVAGLIELTI